jgi:hypothetical protein
MNRRASLLLILLSAVIPANVGAVTKEEYLKSVDEYVSHEMAGRWQQMVNAVLNAPNPPPDGKFALGGRVEFSNSLPIAIAGVYRRQKGDVSGGDKLLNDSLQIIRTANKATVDNYDVDKMEDGTSRGQLNFAMRHLVDTCRILKEQGVLKGEDLKRARSMMEISSDYRMKLVPQPGMGGMSNHMNNYALGILMVSNFLEQELREDPEFAKERSDLPAKIERMRLWSSLPLRAGMNYPYLYKLLPDGTVSQPIRDLGRGNFDEHPVINEPPRFGITENASGYDSASVFELLRLIEEMPPKYVPELTDARRREACDWAMDWSRLIMPPGVIPSYCDSTWGPDGLWIAAFEQAARQFKDQSKYGDASAHFRDSADRIFRFACDAAQGTGIYGGFEAVPVTDDSITPNGITQTSSIVNQQSPAGKSVPGKVILLGRAADRKDAPFAMFNTFYNSSHSHLSQGGIIAYGSGGSIFLHETDYDAGPMYFHDIFIVRPSGEPFLPFSKVFKDPKETTLEKNRSGLDTNLRELLSAEINDLPGYSSTRIVTTVKSAEMQGELTREAVLEKDSGILMVFDTLTNRGKAKPFACGPLWHVQNILARTPEGFLCQDDAQVIDDPKSPHPRTITSVARPVWIGMAGPTGSTLGSETWQFFARHGRSKAPQKEHLYLRCEGSPVVAESVSTLSVFVPMPKGTSSVTNPPALPHIEGPTTGSVTVGNRLYRFDHNKKSVEVQEKH